MDSASGFTGMKVLVAAGDCHGCESFGVFFRMIGCTPHVVGSASEGLEAAKTHRFDLILSDDWLTDLDGVSFLESCIAHQEGAVRILMSAYFHDMAPLKVDPAVIDEVLRKPFTGKELCDLLRRHSCGRRNADPALPYPSVSIGSSSL